MKTHLAPVVLFVFNRPEHTQKTVESLLKNDGCNATDLYIYSDAPRNYKDILGVQKTREYIHSIVGFKSINVTEREENWGLARSIESGVTEVLDKRKRAIVLEDDIVCSPDFLKYMNDALDLYCDDERVKHISAYTPPIDITGLPETFFGQHPHVWGWATWIRAWKIYTNDTILLKEKLDETGEVSRFNFEDTFNYYEHLIANLTGQIHTWAIKWQTAIFLENGLVLQPRVTLTQNIGHDGSGTNSGITNVYQHNQIGDSVALKKVSIEEHPIFRDRLKQFYSRQTPVQSSSLSKWQKLRKNLIGMLKKYKFFQLLLQVYRMRKSKKSANNAEVTTEFSQLYYHSVLLPKVRFYPPRPLLREHPKQILHINTFARAGGAAVIASNLKRIQNKSGMHASLSVGFNDDPHQEKVYLSPRVKTKEQRVLEKFQEENGWLDFFRLGNFDLPKLKEFAEADIIHLHNLHGNYFSKFSLPYLTSLKPTIWTLHDVQALTDHAGVVFDPVKKNKYGMLKSDSLDSYPSIEKEAGIFISKNNNEIYSNSNFFIVCVSEWLSNLVDQTPLSRKPRKVIYNGIDLRVFKPHSKYESRLNLDLPQDLFIILFSANQSEKSNYKNPEDVLEVYKNLSNIDQYFFLNIGGDKKNFINLPNWKNIEHIANPEILAKYYSAADVFLYPSKADSFGLVVAEAMACGLPVVAYSIGGIPEIIINRKTGFLARLGDINELIKNVENLIGNKNLYHEFSEASQQRVVHFFDQNKMHEEYFKLYQKIFYDWDKKHGHHDGFHKTS